MDKKIKINKSDCDFDISKIKNIVNADVHDDFIEITFELGE